ncbi:hypothetical protein COT97_01055 [Candidatus Falkowbacteria bacterium CG10_big_fil_rev_8_21_14_0_10_39_11]|uniref:Uncharacterized protein n=1 Tax=Candidatus Falkowbacteria bacterium CG10_big_fil_rev_8_21_14_0_10_39_11 TaxID=1974565 RepID=A0A2H0V5X5_9BACT|nr:MAG: hypothetical protein COT97_01055 [Candidatus Falkowbacteria bacterium CG10_big_fil_rev_8_21_14_0_10_39_11]
MKDLEQIFNRIQEKTKKMKDIRSAIKDSLETTPGYKEVAEEMIKIREKKKSIEMVVKEQFNAELGELDELKTDVDSDKEMMSDLAMTQMMKGETIELTDKYEVSYEPVFSVKFRKLN